MLRTKNLKLIRLSRGGDEPLYELYDMADEPVEVRNAFDDPAYRDRREDLRADLDAWWARQSGAYPDELKSYAKH